MKSWSLRHLFSSHHFLSFWVHFKLLFWSKHDKGSSPHLHHKIFYSLDSQSVIQKIQETVKSKLGLAYGRFYTFYNGLETVLAIDHWLSRRWNFLLSSKYARLLFLNSAIAIEASLIAPFSMSRFYSFLQIHFKRFLW